MYNVFLINHIEGNTLTYGQTELLDHMVYPADVRTYIEDYDEWNIQNLIVWGENMMLSIGIAPQVVMKFTGHSDYKSMKPDIDITESANKDAIKKMEEAFKK